MPILVGGTNGDAPSRRAANGVNVVLAINEHLRQASELSGEVVVNKEDVHRTFAVDERSLHVSGPIANGPWP